jgi:cysteinyl-tRNA synthetase
MWTNERLIQATKEVTRLRQVLNSQTVAPTEALAIDIVRFLSDDLDTPSVVKALNNWVDACLRGEGGGDRQKIISVLENLVGFEIK